MTVQSADEENKMPKDLYELKTGKKIVETLIAFGIKSTYKGFTFGCTYTLYEIEVDPGTRISSVLCHEDDLAMALSVKSVRILAPIPDKSSIGVEVPDRISCSIHFDSFLPELENSSFVIPIPVGRDVYGKNHITDLTKCPHLLLAGNPGSGKTIFINSLIHSIVLTRTPSEVKLSLIDTKDILYSERMEIPNLLVPIITEPKTALDFFDYLFEEMERRLVFLKERGVRNISEYNEGISEDDRSNQKMPYIVVIVDEYSDLMLEDGRWFESMIMQIAPKGKTVGIHLVMSTNRCTSDVITGVIKTHFPSQIAFSVSSGLNSRIIIDQLGAERLLGCGDFLYCANDSQVPLRLQGIDMIYKGHCFSYK